MNFSLKGYWKPTPKLIRQIADAVLATATSSAILSAMEGHPKIGIAITVTAIIAKFISNFFTVDQTPQQ